MITVGTSSSSFEHLMAFKMSNYRHKETIKKIIKYEMEVTMSITKIIAL
jgi:hypothetical protein